MTDLSQYGECLIEIERQKMLLDTWRLALQTIANGRGSAEWGRIALAALDKEQRHG